MDGNPITGGAKVGNLVLLLQGGYYGIITKYCSRTETFTIFLGNGLTVEAKRQEFACLPLYYGRSLDTDTVFASFHEIIRPS